MEVPVMYDEPGEASSTTRPVASVKPNRNCTAWITWSSTPWTWLSCAETSMTVRLGNCRASASVGDRESNTTHERKHEALATVRLVNKDGDVIWSTTQESTGAKFRGASADVADRITRQLLADIQRLRKQN